jgi:hypothetical protein
MTVYDAMISENTWWVNSWTTRHIARNRDLFVEIKEKIVGEHIVYIGNHQPYMLGFMP